MIVLSRQSFSFQVCSLICRPLLLALGFLGLATVAAATEVKLRDEFQTTPVPTGSQQEGWEWLTLYDPSGLDGLPANWRLLVDQVRFEQIEIVVTRKNGQSDRIFRTADDLQENWAPGGVLSFDIPVPGREIARLAIGFKDIDDLSLMRKVTAVSRDRGAELDVRWIALICLLAGILLSGFVYNLLLHIGQRHPLQRWYLAWVLVVFAYGLTWSNVGAYLIPGLFGPTAARLNCMLVATAVALGCMFLLSVLEIGSTPRRLRRALQLAAGLAFASGLLAADERMIAASLSDFLLNCSMIVSVLLSVVVIAFAIFRKSRVVWMYLIGWTPVITVFVIRVARNLGFAEQSDIVDYATFAAVGFEALIFSLLIASRFSVLRKQRDAAQAAAREMHIEQRTLQRAAQTDVLTGLGNRAHFNAVLAKSWGDAVPFSLYLIDVDYLKELNDQQGHDAGDALLRHIGEKLAGLARLAPCAARIGGDEFAIIAFEGDEALAISDDLSALQGSLWMHDNTQGLLSMSIGQASSANARSVEDLFKHADLALYRAKKEGRGRLAIFNTSMQLGLQAQTELIKDAQEAIVRQQFVLHFQPIVDLQANALAGVEALLRWNHPKRGLLAPGAFGCVLDDPQVGPEVQRCVLELAVEWLRKNQSDVHSLAVNFSSMDLRGTDSARIVLSMLSRAGVRPSAFCVEVTEGTILGRGKSESVEALHMLHAAGVRVALDDFGTGYASLIHLKKIPVDILKIDRSFVSAILTDNGMSEQIVLAIVALGQALGKQVIAEGVETTAQLQRLRELGCIHVQGFLTGRPSASLTFPRIVEQAA